MAIVAIFVVVGIAFVILGGASVFGKLQPSDIAGYASNAGWSGSDLTMAVAVALAESGGDPSAVGDLAIVKPNGSIGLWQINTNAHPEFDWTQLKDPQYNANAAYQIYVKARGFTPWSTYNNGISATLIGQASDGVTQMQQTSGQSA